MTDSAKESLMRTLQQTHFIMLDLKLYIDTHSDCASAQQAFSTAQSTYAQALENLHASQNPDHIAGPWPWEGGAPHVEL